MANQLFERIPPLQVMICRQCRYGVWPGEAKQHLKRQHQLNYTTVARLVHEIQQWTDVAAHAQAVQIPHTLDKPLPILPSYSQGILCRRDPTTCHYLVSSMKAMRTHWQRVHQWSQYPKHGRGPQSQQAQREAKLQQSYKTVSYQQLFPSQASSHYIHIRFPHGQAPPPPQPSQAQQAIDAVVQAWEQAEAARQQAPVKPTQLHNTNPWLRMTQWTEYLQDISPADLLRSIKAPNPNTANPIEQGVLTLYHTVNQLTRKSQQTVTYCGQAIRIEAVHTQAAELPHQPLLAYIDTTSVQKHMQPWQQILGFFAHTQHPQAWQSPAYQFTARQQQK